MCGGDDDVRFFLSSRRYSAALYCFEGGYPRTLTPPSSKLAGKSRRTSIVDRIVLASRPIPSRHPNCCGHVALELAYTPVPILGLLLNCAINIARLLMQYLKFANENNFVVFRDRCRKNTPTDTDPKADLAWPDLTWPDPLTTLTSTSSFFPPFYKPRLRSFATPEISNEDVDCALLAGHALSDDSKLQLSNAIVFGW